MENREICQTVIAKLSGQHMQGTNLTFFILRFLEPLKV